MDWTVWNDYNLNEPSRPPQEPNLTLRHLWASGYQVILSYESQEAAGYQDLWPEIPYWWANKHTADEVISYMDCKKDSGRPGYTLKTPLWMSFSGILIQFHTTDFGNKLFSSEGFFVCGLNLTADRPYITKNSKQSLRTLTFANWKSLRNWLEEQKPGGDHESLNIIAGDFVGPLPLCSLVIALNLKLL